MSNIVERNGGEPVPDGFYTGLAYLVVTKKADGNEKLTSTFINRNASKFWFATIEGFIDVETCIADYIFPIDTADGRTVTCISRPYWEKFDKNGTEERSGNYEKLSVDEEQFFFPIVSPAWHAVAKKLGLTTDVNTGSLNYQAMEELFDTIRDEYDLEELGIDL